MRSVDILVLYLIGIGVALGFVIFEVVPWLWRAFKPTLLIWLS